MIYSKFDFFSTHFSFNTGNYQTKRGTLFGVMLSLSILIITISYFVYIIQQYANNQIEPTFRSQSFINDDLIEVPLKNELVGFRFEYGTNANAQQLSPDKTYLVYLAFFFYSSPNDNQFIPLSVINCTDSNLLGFKCLDFSSVQNYTLSLNTNQNIKSSVQILTYGCRDIDSLKTFVPDNCAEQSDIDNMVNGINSVLRFKLYTSQYNTTSQRMEANYRNAYVYTIASQSIITQLKTQNQNTSIKQGLVVQTQQSFYSPIQYIQQDLSYDRQYALKNIGGGAYSVCLIFVDEIIQQIQIQYPTLPQVFALVNSIFTLLMFSGILGRIVSQNSINKDFLMLFLKNIYQDNYLQILRTKKPPLQIQEEVSSNLERQQDFEEKKSFHHQESQNTNNLPLVSIPNSQIQRKQSAEQNKDYESISSKQNNLFLPQSCSQKIGTQCIPQINIEQNNIFQGPINNVNLLKSNFITDADSIMSGEVNFQNKPVQRDFFYSISPQNFTLIKSGFNKQINQTFISGKDNDYNLNDNQREDLIKHFQSIQNANCSNNMKNNIFEKHSFKKNLKLDLKGLKLQKIQYQIKKDLNILNFVSDIILLKKAVMMILTKDQLAAMHLIGCSNSFLELNLRGKDINLDDIGKLIIKTILFIYFDYKEKDQKLSHYEVQFAISQSQKFQEYQIQQFLSRCSTQGDLSGLDKKILSSIQKCHLN